MTIETLRSKTARYLCGEAGKAEQEQIQTWLSCTPHTVAEDSPEQRDQIENEIIAQVSAYVTSSLSIVPRTEPWWRKITASF